VLLCLIEVAICEVFSSFYCTSPSLSAGKGIVLPEGHALGFYMIYVSTYLGVIGSLFWPEHINLYEMLVGVGISLDG